MGFLNDFFKECESEDFSLKTDDINEIKELYKKFLVSMTLPEMVFPQFNSKKFDSCEDSYTNDDYKYIELFANLTECIRITKWVYPSGKSASPNYLQEQYIRFALAGLVLSNMNSWNDAYKEINYYLNLNFSNIMIEVEIEEKNPMLFGIDVIIKLFNRFGDTVKTEIKKDLNIDPNIYYGENPFELCYIFNDSPKDLILKYHEIIKKLMDNVAMIEKKRLLDDSKKYMWANIWLLKILALFIMKKDRDIIKSEKFEIKKADYEIDNINNMVVIDYIYSDENGNDIKTSENYVIANNRILETDILPFVKNMISEK